MKTWERWTFNVSAAAITLTGVLYFWMKYLLVSDDPFALVNHPWQITTLNLHILVAPLFVLIFGVVLNSHVLKKLKAFRGPGRLSGLLSLALFAVMVTSGYALQMLTAELALTVSVWLHAGSGIGFALAYSIHLINSIRLTRRRPALPRIREVA
jgi:hypothetical protein